MIFGFLAALYVMELMLGVGMLSYYAAAYVLG